MKLTFLGATSTVTGSKYLLENNGKKVLVDCGLYQGLKPLRLRNWENLPVSPASIDAVVLTHAHIDHSGYVPLMVKRGFKGKVFCSSATVDLCAILLPDSGFLQEADAERANRYGYSKHKPALPLYTQKDAETALQQFRAVDFGVPVNVVDDMSITFSRAGHILGAASIQVSDGQSSILFSGDLGRPEDPVMKAPAKLQGADYLVLESTYGDRRHADINPIDKMGEIIKKTLGRGGSVIIPAFAVGRTQSILYYLHQLKETNTIPDTVPIYLDSPMAINATKLLAQHKNDHRLPAPLCADVCNIAKYVQTTEDSKALDMPNAVPRIILSASGMATGGRIVHHLKHFIGDPRNTILFTGYQAASTRGARLMHGEDQIKIHGEMWKVRAEIAELQNTSAHADYAEILQWLDRFQVTPRRVFITHGEPEAATSLRMKIQDRYGWNTIVPDYLQQEEL